MSSDLIEITEETHTIEISGGDTTELTQEIATVEITDGGTVEITEQLTTVEITPEPAATVEVQEPDKVIVHACGIGSGIAGFYSKSEILELLTDSITLDQMQPAIESDLITLASLWDRIGDQTNVYTTAEAAALSSTLTTNFTNADILLQSNINDNSADILALTNEFAAYEPPNPTQSELITILDGAITIDMMDAPLYSDLTLLGNLWSKVASDINDLMVQSDGETITQAQQTYTNGKFTTAVTQIEEVEDLTVANQAAITVEAGKIDSAVVRITAIDGAGVPGEGYLEVERSRITQNASDITSTVERLELIDGEDGYLDQQQSQITQTASTVNVHASRITTVEGRSIQNDADIDVNNSEIQAYVTQLNTATGDIDSVELRMTAAEFAIEANSGNMTALQTMTADRWGVVIAEDSTNGDLPYVTGVGLLVIPNWADGTAYKTNIVGPPAVEAEQVWYNDKIYKCLQNHTATVATAPGTAGGAAYWAVTTDGYKSSFRVKADEFSLWTSSSAPDQPLFQVTGDAITVGSGISFKSDGFDTGAAGYKLDAVNKQATFRDVSLTFTDNDEQAAFRNGNAMPQLFITEPTTADAYYKGDMWDRGTNLGIWTAVANKAAGVTYSISDWTNRADPTVSTVEDGVTLATGGITLSGSSSIRTTGKDNYYDTTAGLYFGYDAYANLPDRNNTGTWEAGTYYQDAHVKYGGVGYKVTATSTTKEPGVTSGWDDDWDIVTGAYTFIVGNSDNYLAWDGFNLILEGGKLQSSNGKRFINLDAAGSQRFLQLQDDTGIDHFWVDALGNGFIRREWVSLEYNKTYYHSNDLPNWVSGTTYAEGDLVYSSSKAWRALRPTQATTTAPAENDDWTDTSNTIGRSGETFTVPTGITSIRVTMCGGGGGGGGGGGNGSGNGASGGGGSNAYYKESFTVTPGGTHAVTVGAGGTGGTGSYYGTKSVGTAGGSTSLAGITNCAVGGATGGGAADSSNASRGGDHGSTITSIYGARGGDGDGFIDDDPEQPSGSFVSGTTAHDSGSPPGCGGAACGCLGDGGDGTPGHSGGPPGDGRPGTGYGSGGGGGGCGDKNGGANGGNGANGYILIEWG
jgi:hypothetical protein